MYTGRISVMTCGGGGGWNTGTGTGTGSRITLSMMDVRDRGSCSCRVDMEPRMLPSISGGIGGGRDLRDLLLALLPLMVLPYSTLNASGIGCLTGE